jgi:hypothetical protein
MNHPDDDTLLKLVLETLDDVDVAPLREHLSACRGCTEKKERIEAEVGRLRGIAVRVEGVAPRLPRGRRVLLVAVGAAAILVVGFFSGYLTAELSNPIRPSPVQQRLIPASPVASSTGYISCQAVDLGH